MKNINYLENPNLKMNQDVKELIQALQNQDGIVRSYAASALGGIGSGTKDAVPALIQVLPHYRRNIVRGNVATALGGIGEGAKDAVPALIQTLKDQDAGVRGHVSEALCRIGKEGVVDTVIPMLQDIDPFVRSRTAHALGEIGPGAKDADIYLIPLLKDPDNNVRKDVEWALGKINTPDARRALRYE